MYNHFENTCKTPTNTSKTPITTYNTLMKHL